MNTLCAPYNMSSDFAYYYDATVPASPDEMSSDSIGTPLDSVPFPFVEDQQSAFESSQSLGFPAQYSVDQFCNVPGQEPNATSCLPYSLQEGVLASLEALKACDPQKGYPTKQHTPMKKIKAHVGKSVQEEERIVRRRTKNREAAQASRLRKRQRLEHLEGLVAEQKAITAQLIGERDTIQRENATLRSEVEYLKEALRTSMEGLRGVDTDQLFAQVQLGL